MKLRTKSEKESNTAPANGGSRTGQTDAWADQDQEQSPEPQPARKVPVRGQEEMLGVVFKLQRDLYEHGKRRGIESGALVPSEEDLRALEAHATAIARETHRDSYNPSQHWHDQLLDHEYQKNLFDRDQAEHAVQYAAAAVRDGGKEAAAAHPGDAPKPSSEVLPSAAVIAMMITIAPTLHDFVFVIADEFFSWLSSVFSGLFLGLLITLLIMGDADHSEQRTPTNWVGLCAGVFVSVALGGLRIKGAATVGDYIFAAAMTLLELGIVIGLEAVATSRRTRQQGWAARKIAADRAAAKLQAAQADLKRCRERLEGINQAIAAHINYVEERGVRSQRIEEIVATALQAVRDGYQAGIAENRGRVLGVRRNEV